MGLDLANLAKAEIEVLSVIETKENIYMEKTDTYHNDPTSSIRNIELTESARSRMQARVEEIAAWAPELELTPKILYGDRSQVLAEEVAKQGADLVIMGGDLYDPSDQKANEFFHQVDAPVLILKCMIDGLAQFKDIIFLADLENDSSELIKHLKDLQRLLGAKIHVLRINTPKNFLSLKKCTESLESYANRYELENYELVSRDAPSEKEGLLAYCDTIQHAFVATAVHQRTFLQSLMNNKDDQREIIANSVHPIWMFKN